MTTPVRLLYQLRLIMGSSLIDDLVLATTHVISLVASEGDSATLVIMAVATVSICYVTWMLLMTGIEGAKSKDVITPIEERKPRPTLFYTDSLPTDLSRCYVKDCPRRTFLPSIGNGYVGTIAMSDEVHVAGLYNGKAYVKPRSGWPVYYYEHTHRARIPSTLSIDFTLDIPGKRSYALDVRSGTYVQWFEGNGIQIEQRLYAHRRYKNIAVNEIVVKSAVDTTLHLTLNRGNDSVDLVTLQNDAEEVDSVDLQDEHYDTTAVQFKTMFASAKEAETSSVDKTKIAVTWTPVPLKLKIKKCQEGCKFRFVSAYVTSLETPNPEAKSQELWMKYSKLPFLYETHAKEWNNLWDSGSIKIADDINLAQLTYGSLYNLLSSIRPDWQFGLSPGGLPASEEYLGHVFWDQDIWMYPGLLMMFPDIAKTALEYRHKRMGAAEKIAASRGYSGEELLMCSIQL